MNKERSRHPINRQIVEEAAEWFVEVNEDDPDVATRRQFHEWMSRSPEHLRAYLSLLPVWEEGAQLDTYANGDPDALIAWARSSTNIISLPSSIPSPAKRGRVREGARIKMLAAALAAIAITATWLYISHNTYATDTGEQRVIALSDGSKVELNSRSRVKIHFTGRERAIELLDGQALFEVAKDPARPFTVNSGDTSVRALGTQFDVYRRKSGTTVTVIEGRVAVSSPHGQPGISAPIPLTAGEQLTVSPSVAAKPKRTSVATVTAWTQQRLIFSNTPLDEVAEEFNRHNKWHLHVKDESLKAIHVSGTFSSTNPASLVRFLKAQPGVRVEETDSGAEVFPAQ